MVLFLLLIDIPMIPMSHRCGTSIAAKYADNPEACQVVNPDVGNPDALTKSRLGCSLGLCNPDDG